MDTGIPVMAVFDIGKTNKKLLLFDRSYQVLKEEVVRFEETKDEDGFACEDLSQLTSWMLARYRELRRSREFKLRSINFSTYGASLVHLDRMGRPTGPLYNYLKPYPEGLQKKFVQEFGEELIVDTCSPLMGHLNAGLQLYRLKEESSAQFDRIVNTLHFPQYLSFLLTGKKFAEMTNVGCHSAMWHFKNMEYHGWLEKAGLLSRLCSITPGSHVVQVKGESPGDTLAIGIGLHDSSAALIPYLRTTTEPFLVLSTGTWTISLNPFSQSLPTSAELSSGCLSYLTYEGRPVKTSMLFAGHDHDSQVRRIASQFQQAPDFFKEVGSDIALMKECWQEACRKGKAADKHLPGSATEPCCFHLRELTAFSDFRHAYLQLLADLVYQQSLYTRMVLQNSPVKNIYVDGGFCRNEIYMGYVSVAFPDKNVYAASMVQGTALGAALAIHTHWNSQQNAAHLLQLKKWDPNTLSQEAPNNIVQPAKGN